MEAFDIDKVLESLSNSRPVFSKKVDFRDSLSSEIYKLYPSAVIEKNPHDQCDVDKRIDLRVFYDDINYYLTLYYKVANLEVCSQDASKSFNNTNENDTMYAFWEDVSSMEHIHKADGDKAIGFVILLTNAPRYWMVPKTGGSKKRTDFLLYEKREVKDQILEYPGKSPIRIRGSYLLSWNDYSDVSGFGSGDTQLRYLCLAIPRSYKRLQDVTVINSFSEFLNVIPDIDVPLFYRGQAGLEYLPLPSALRSNTKPDYENDVFMSVLTKQPDEYFGIANLQKLAKLQHKSLPTRLLDISVNPLVALFFAVSSIRDADYDTNNKDKDGWVFRFTPVSGDGESRPIRLFDSDTCRVLAALASISDKDKQEIRYQAVMDYFIQCYIYGIRKKACPHIVKYSLEHKVLTTVLHVLFQNVLSHIYEKKRLAMLNGYQKGFPFKPFSLGAGKGIASSTERLALKGLESYISSGETNARVVCRVLDKVLHSFKAVDDTFTVLGIGFRCCLIPSGDDYYAVFFLDPIDQIHEGCLMQDVIGNDPEDREDSMPMYINPETGEYYCYELMKLYGKVAAECPAFKMCTYPLDLLDGSFVRPIFNSDRMVAQQGSFMMYGLSAFWDVRRMIRYLLKQKKSLQAILGILILNDVKVVEGGKDTAKIIDYLINVLGAAVWKIPSAMRCDIKKRLRSFGISKDTLGRSEETTAYEIDDR